MVLCFPLVSQINKSRGNIGTIHVTISTHFPLEIESNKRIKKKSIREFNTKKNEND